MQRWQGAALAVALCSSCLDPMVDDQPGYSRLVVPADTPIAYVYADPSVARKIDMNDGVGMGPIAIKTGYAAGAEVKYWDLGPARRPAPAYVLCSGIGPDGRPLQLMHPPIFESIPGEGDYSPFRAIYPVVITPRYAGQLLTSVEALAEAFELGLVNEPGAASGWRNYPVVSPNVDLNLGNTVRRASEAYFEGRVVLFHHLGDQEGEFPSAPPIDPGWAFEIVRADAPTTILKTIFSQPFRAADGSRNAKYSPQWTPVTVTLKPTNASMPSERQEEDVEISSWTRDTDLVTYPPMGMSTNPLPVKKEGTRVATLTVAPVSGRVNRPFLINEVVP